MFGKRSWTDDAMKREVKTRDLISQHVSEVYRTQPNRPENI